MESNPSPQEQIPAGSQKIHEFYEFMREVELPKIMQMFVQHMQQTKTEQFPIKDFALSCYMQAMSDIMECLATLEWDLNAEATGTEHRKKAIQEGLDLFKVMKEAWLMMKFQVPGVN